MACPIEPEPMTKTTSPMELLLLTDCRAARQPASRPFACWLMDASVGAESSASKLLDKHGLIATAHEWRAARVAFTRGRTCWERSSAVFLQRINQQRERRRRLASARVLQVAARKRWRPFSEYPKTVATEEQVCGIEHRRDPGATTVDCHLSERRMRVVAGFQVRWRHQRDI